MPSNTPDLAAPVSEPIHRAIDRLTAIMLDLQRLRRRVALQDGVADDLARIEALVQELADALRDVRETAD